MSDVAPEIVERALTLVRRMTDGPAYLDGPVAREARAIVALLPEPVDPDLVEAREIVCAKFPDGTYLETGPETQAVLAAIKRGRQLATGATND